MSNHNSIATDNSTSNRASTRTGRSKTPSLRKRLKKRISGGNSNDDSIRSDCSQRSRSLSPPRSKSEKVPLTYQDDSNIMSPIKVLRSPQKVNSSERTRSRSLSASIQNGIRNVVRRISISNRADPDEECEVPLSSSSKFMRKSKSHHVRPEHDDDNNSRSGRSRSIFRGGSRSLSCHQRRKSRRSRSRGDPENDVEDEDIEEVTPQSKGVVFASSGQTDLVVKILQPKLMNQPKLFANCAAGLIREGLFLASIDHPHVLKVHAWTSPNGWMDFAALAQKEGDLYDGYLLVLERLTGGSLKGWMRKWQIEHAEEQKAIAAVAAAEEKKLEKSQRKRLGLARTLSFTGSSMESNSISGSSQHLRHTILRRKEKECGSPQSTATDSTYSQFSNSDRSLPYDCKWPTTQLADRMSLLMQLSDTVKYLHKHRILHRDLKPDNLGVTFVDPNTKQKKEYPSNLSLKVFDFDIARLVPEDPTEEKSSRKSKHKRRGQSVDGSIKSLDADMMVSKRGGRSVGGRSVSPLRSSSSLGAGDPSQRSRRKKYRGQRPAGRPNNTTDQPASPIPTVISAVTLEEPEALPRDALFEMTAKMGSPRYMAPEIARGEAYNLKSEVYTVCLLVHEVLTLQKPYDELAPEDHSKLVHFDLPGYRPPIYSEWEWPAELEEVLHLGFGDISQRPSMKDVHGVLKKALPRICPELLMRKASPIVPVDPDATMAASNSSRRTRSVVTTPPCAVCAPSLISRSHSEAEKDHSKKKGGRSLFRSQHSRHSTRSGHKHRSSSLTPTASNSDFSLSNDEPLAVASVVQ